MATWRTGRPPPANARLGATVNESTTLTNRERRENIAFLVQAWSAHAPQAAIGPAHAIELGQLQAVGVAEDHPLDATATIDEQTDATVELVGQLEQVAGQRTRDHAVGRQAPLADTRECSGLARLEVRGVAVNDVAHGLRVGVGPRLTRAP